MEAGPWLPYSSAQAGMSGDGEPAIGLSSAFEDEPSMPDRAPPTMIATTAAPATPTYARLRRRARRPAPRYDEAGAVGR